MKQKLLVALPVLFFMLTGCGSEAKLHVYEYPAAYDESNIMKYTGDSYEYKKTDNYVDASAVQSFSFDLAGVQYELAYQDTDQKEFVPYEEENYISQGGLEISFKKGTEEVCGIQSEDGLRISSLENPKTEEDFRRISETFVKEYIVPENYICSLATEVAHFVQEGEKASRWFETKDFFYIGSPGTESVKYIFTYIRYLDGYQTSDIAEIILNPNGTLDRMMLINIGAFEDAGERMVGRDALDRAVLEKVNAICSEGYKIENVQNDVIVCIDENGQLFFLVSAKPTIRVASNNEQLEGTCIFIVAGE